MGRFAKLLVSWSSLTGVGTRWPAAVSPYTRWDPTLLELTTIGDVPVARAKVEGLRQVWGTKMKVP